jgi:DNA (cytosine-5)-methyltransferase 1
VEPLQLALRVVIERCMPSPPKRSPLRHAAGTRDPRYSSLDLFAGAGGFSLGLELAGFRSAGAVEIDEVAGRTYRSNFGERPLLRFGPKHGDMRRVSPPEIRRALAATGVDELDLLVAAPPCQGFSRVGRGKLDFMAARDGAFVLDSRNHLYRQAVAMLAELQPRTFLFENVAGILHVGGHNMAERVCRAVASVGYTVRCALLNSAWYGVPQSRERLFLIGVRDDLGVAPRFPAREHEVRVRRGHLSQADMNPSNWSDPSFFVGFENLPGVARLKPPVTVSAAFADLPAFTRHLLALRTGAKYRPRRELMPTMTYRRAPPNGYCALMRRWLGLPVPEGVTDHYCRWTPRDFETFRRMKPDDRYKQALVIAEARYQEARVRWALDEAPFPRRSQFVPPYPDDCFDEKWRKLDRHQPAYTITAHLAKDTYSHIHPNGREARAITIREAARLQSFPDGFAFAGNMGDMFRQIGNAVPPLLAAAVGRSIWELLHDIDEQAGEPCTAIPARQRSASGM